MRPWIKRGLLGLSGLAIALGGLTACGHHRGPAGWNASPEEQAAMRDRMVTRISSKLELNAEQQAKLATLADRLQEQRRALRGEAADPRAEWTALIAGPQFDRARAQALVSGKAAAVEAGSPKVIAAAGDFYDSLTPVQQAKVREFLQHRGGWMRRG